MNTIGPSAYSLLKCYPKDLIRAYGSGAFFLKSLFDKKAGFSPN